MHLDVQRYLERIQALESENSALSADNRDLQLRQTALLTELALCKEALERIADEVELASADRSVTEDDPRFEAGMDHAVAMLRSRLEAFPLDQED